MTGKDPHVEGPQLTLVQMYRCPDSRTDRLPCKTKHKSWSFKLKKPAFERVTNQAKSKCQLSNTILSLRNENNCNSPSSCLVKITNFYVRTLIDTGASFSIIASQLLSRIPYAKINKNNHIKLLGITVTHLDIKGTTDVSFDIGKQTITHTFVVCEHIAEQMILGTDFLKKYEVNINYKNRTISLNNDTIQLESHNHMTSLGKAARNIKIKPNSTTICFVKARQQRNMLISENEYLVTRIDSGVLANEPGIYAADGLVKINSVRKFPIMIVISTNRHVNIKKGNMIAKLEAINSVCSFRQTLLQELKGDIDSSEDSVKQPIVPNRVRKSRPTLQNKVRLKVHPEQLTLFVKTSVPFKKCII